MILSTEDRKFLTDAGFRQLGKDERHWGKKVGLADSIVWYMEEFVDDTFAGVIPGVKPKKHKAGWKSSATANLSKSKFRLRLSGSNNFDLAASLESAISSSIEAAEELTQELCSIVDEFRATAQT